MMLFGEVTRVFLADAREQRGKAISSDTTGINTGHDVTTIQQDASLMPRPSRILTAGATLMNFDTGTYSYDGGGNILAMGTDGFGYDPRSRITAASLTGVGNQSLSYDRFGNLLSKGSTTYSVSPLTNRLTPTPQRPLAFRCSDSCHPTDSSHRCLISSSHGEAPEIHIPGWRPCRPKSAGWGQASAQKRFSHFHIYFDDMACVDVIASSFLPGGG